MSETRPAAELTARLAAARELSFDLRLRRLIAVETGRGLAKHALLMRLHSEMLMATPGLRRISLPGSVYTRSATGAC